MRMTPNCGDNVLLHVGDWIHFKLDLNDLPNPSAYKYFLRTTLGQERLIEKTIVHAQSHKWPLRGSSWIDYPMTVEGNVAKIDIPACEVGYFEGKCYAVTEEGRQIWVDGPNVGISVHPDFCRTGNIIYCAFTRLFGENKTRVKALPEAAESQMQLLDEKGFTCIPPSGKFRDLKRELTHIIDTLGCKIIHLLPVNPTPTTMARMGRFGSPYAALDLTAIDLSLVEFEKETTAEDQFCELADAIHHKGAKLFIDLAINHTGWGSTLHEKHPEWYAKDNNGSFISPGAWGVTWGDLSELNTHLPDLWKYLAEVFLVWCRRGVDGFRCDAGYKIPVEAWRYIILRVHQEFPNTVFLLEGLGGSWEATEKLLTEGRMQFAYSELFQNYSGRDVANYLNYSLEISQRKGVWVHYSETHDNNRLAANGKKWSLFRNQLCALTSVNGGFGYTCGVEWLATEKILVHQRSGLSWGNPDNIVPELGLLSKLLLGHPCFWDGSKLTRISEINSAIYVLRRESKDGKHTVFVLANTDFDNDHEFCLQYENAPETWFNLLTGRSVLPVLKQGNEARFTIPKGCCYCLSASDFNLENEGEIYREDRALASWGLSQICEMIPLPEISPVDYKELSKVIAQNPVHFLGCVSNLASCWNRTNWMENIRTAMGKPVYYPVIKWQQEDLSRILVLPREHWILLCEDEPFAMRLKCGTSASVITNSVKTSCGNIATFSPAQIKQLVTESRNVTEMTLYVQFYGSGWKRLESHILYVSEIEQNTEENLVSMVKSIPGGTQSWVLEQGKKISLCCGTDKVVLLTNGRGSMARINADLGRINSKYDCLLGANLNKEYPVDRHVFVKRLRLWANANSFITPLDAASLVTLNAEQPATWLFAVPAGGGKSAIIQLKMDLSENRNTVVLSLKKVIPPGHNEFIAENIRITVTARFDIEDRSFHSETHLNDGARWHFRQHTHSLRNKSGFEFTPAADRFFKIYCTQGIYHEQEEWCEGIYHPIESGRGQTDHGDAFSPGWFEIDISEENPVYFVVDAEQDDLSQDAIFGFEKQRQQHKEIVLNKAGKTVDSDWERTLRLSLDSFLVRRGLNNGKTVVAGYPWFLDWGRDSLICAVNYLEAGYWDEVLELAGTFASMERDGTLPNCVYGGNDSNRDTVDAALWLGIVIEKLTETAPIYGFDAEYVLSKTVDQSGRTFRDILESIANGYIKGTFNGIKFDKGSGLIWSPAHFTWMDTNYPAGTPRCGYPIEIESLWVRLLQQLVRIIPDKTKAQRYEDLALLAKQSLNRLYWLENKGWFADGLWAEDGAPAKNARVDDALRPNQFLGIALGILGNPKHLQKAVQSGIQWLLIPGATRSLAPLPVDCLAPVYGKNGGLLNDPSHPYWHEYMGDEDTRRKPAYHNGTAWAFPLGWLCKAIPVAYNHSKESIQAANCYLRSNEYWLDKGCLGHISEIMDGDYPHTQRGCDAQAWSVLFGIME